MENKKKTSEVLNEKKLIGKLGKEKETFAVELSELASLLSQKVLVDTKITRLQRKKSLLEVCRKENEASLILLYQSKNLTDDIANKVIDRYGLVRLDGYKIDKKATPNWLKQRITEWINENNKKSSAHDQT